MTSDQNNGLLTKDFAAQVAFVDRFLWPVSTDHNLIRVGDFGDGGYLVPDDLGGISTCYSPGVSNQASFEMDLAKRDIRSFLADASVEAPPVSIPNAHFIKKFLGNKDTDTLMTLESWITDTGNSTDKDMILQMDIEGAEYDVLGIVPLKLLERFRIIVLELHFLPSILTKEHFLVKAAKVFSKLEKTHFNVHIHPNNGGGNKEIDGQIIPRAIEMTLLRKDRAGKTMPVQALPHRLDWPNAGRKPDLTIPDRWKV